MDNNKNEIILSARDIRKSFADHDVLKGIDLTARRHDVISIIGSSGSGKSTFLRCLNLLETPSSGTLEINGHQMSFGDGPGQINASHAKQSKALIELRKQVSMVFQSFNLWSHMTVLENVTISPIKVLGVPKNVAIARAEAILQKVGIYDKRNQYPSMLSGGQQQRCAIARALAMEPQVLLFDEPTSALDPELVNEVLKVMRLLAEEGRTMIFVTHEMAFARDISTEVLFLHQGVIEERGAPADVFGNPTSERCRQFLQSVL